MSPPTHRQVRCRVARLVAEVRTRDHLLAAAATTLTAAARSRFDTHLDDGGLFPVLIDVVDVSADVGLLWRELAHTRLPITSVDTHRTT